MSFNFDETQLLILYNVEILLDSNMPIPRSNKHKKYEFGLYYKKCVMAGVYSASNLLTDFQLESFIMQYEKACNSKLEDEIDSSYSYSFSPTVEADFHFKVITNVDNPYDL